MRLGWETFFFCRPPIYSVAEPVLFGHSRSRDEGLAPCSSTLDKTEEILNDILFFCSKID